MTTGTNEQERWYILKSETDRNHQAIFHLEKLIELLQAEQQKQHGSLYVDIGSVVSFQTQISANQVAIEALQHAWERDQLRADRRGQRLWGILLPLAVLWAASTAYWIYQAIQMAQRLPKVP